MSALVLTQHIAVATGTPVTIGRETLQATPCTLAAIPTSGGTLGVEYQLVADGTWIAWPAGAVAATTVYVLSGPVYALRFTTTTKNGVIELAQ